jgi:hypothetical protein
MLAFPALGEVVTLTEKSEQFFCGTEAPLTPGVDLLDLASEVLPGRLCLWSQLYHERPSRHGNQRKLAMQGKA